MVTPNLLNYAKEFYGCSSVDYVPLENDGNDGPDSSHFERSFFFNENMTANDFDNLKFSGFSFKLL